MMDASVFTVQDLILCYVENRRDHHQSELQNYHQQRLKASQEAFGVEFSLNSIRASNARAIWLEFSMKVDSYLRLTAPSGLLEGGLMESQISKLDGMGERINVLRRDIHLSLEENKQKHLELLELLFHVLWQPIHYTVTSDHLLNLGF